MNGGEEEVQEQAADEAASDSSTIPAPSELETPATSNAPSENDCTVGSAPATPAQATFASPKQTPTPSQHVRRDTRTAIAVPNIPGISRPKASPPATSDKPGASPTSQIAVESPSQDQKSADGEVEQVTEDAAVAPAEPAPKPAPKSWADLVRRNAPPPSAASMLNGSLASNISQVSKSASLADALRQYSVQSDTTLSFLEPRGLVNTGNMCYMNSVSLSKAQASRPTY